MKSGSGLGRAFVSRGQRCAWSNYGSALASVAALSLLLFSSVLLQAQSLSGINGTVTDTSGAVVPNVAVTVTNVDTNVVHRTTTTDVGTFHVTDLNPGTYTVKAEKQGFRIFIENGVVVQTGTQTSTNITLTFGRVTETMEVSADPIALETEQPELSTTIQETLVQELPVEIGNNSGRQIDTFMYLAPGVTGGGFSHRINGGLDMQNEVVFNGIPVAAAETQGYQYIINPPYELVKEFSVLQGAFSAQYGLSQGVAQYGWQSGTNRLHGDGFFILRDSFFDAPGAFNDLNKNNQGKLDAPSTDVERNYGFSLGGPVWIPKVYNGKDKTFWYASYDHYYQTSAPGTITVPTPQELNGDFSNLTVPGTSTLIPIIVPIAWATSPALAPTGCTIPGYASPQAAAGNQFPGNMIPASCISSVSKSLFNLIPAPNAGTSEINNYVPQLTRVNIDTNWGLIIDHNLTSKQAVHGAFWRNRRNQPNGPFSNALNNSRLLQYLGTGIVVNYSNTISDHLAVTGGVGWLGELNPQASEYPISNFAGAAPIPGAPQQFLPGISFNNGNWEPTGWGTGGWSFSNNRKLGVSFANNWLYIHGRHTMNFGVDIRRTYQDDYECQQCAGNLNFNARTTSDTSGNTLFALGLCNPPSNVPCPDTEGNFSGNGFASFLLGNVDSGGRQMAANSHLRNYYMAPYFQDNIKITPRLTVDAGLRWDLAFPFSNDNKLNQLVYFDRNAPNPGAIAPNGQPLAGAMAIFGKGCAGCGGFDRMNMKWGHFSPRLGIAYRLTNKTTLLAGLSFSYLDTGAFEYGTNKVAVSFGNALNGTNSFGNNNQIPGLGLWDTSPLPVPAKAPFSPNFLNGQIFTLVHGLHKDVQQAYSELFSFGVQRELPWRMFSSVQYVHTHDVHLPAALLTPNTLSSRYFNQCPTELSDPSLCVLGQPFDSTAGQTYLQSLGMGSCAGLTMPYCNFANDNAGASVYQALVPFPQYGFIQDNYDTSGSDQYNALQTSLQKRTGSGVTFLVSYTLSRTMSNTDSGFTTFNFKSLDREKPQLDWSVANDDRTHVLNIATVYELPIGPGKKLLNKGGLLARNLLGGWQFSGIFTYQSGTPVLVDAEKGPLCSPTVYTTGQCNLANVSPGPFSVNWNNYYSTLGCADITQCPGGKPVFNPNKFVDPGAWTEGNAKQLYSELRNPFQPNETIALAKKFYFGERVNAELRMEFYNVLNRMQPGNCLSSHTAPLPGTPISADPIGYENGQICQGNTPRQGQAFLKITF